MSQDNPNMNRRRRAGNRSDKRLALRIRQISVLLGGMVVLAAGTLWLTGIIKPIGTDSYSGSNAKMNPELVDPALRTAEPSPESAPAAEPTPSSSAAATPAREPTPSTAAASTREPTPSPAATPDSKPTPTAKSTPKPPPTAKPTARPTPTAPSETVIPDEALPASADWLEKRIDAHVDEIDAQDLTDFRRIIGKLDQGYVGDLAANGLETGEQELLKAHLLSRLSATEYERAKVLFSQYNNLMYEK